MMNGSPPSDSFSAVEKNVAYVGYWEMLATTTLDSTTSTLNPACIAEMAQARPHGPAPTIRRSVVVILSAAGARDLLLAEKQVPRFAQDDESFSMIWSRRVP